MYVDPQDDFKRLNDAMSAADMAWWEMELPSGIVFFAEHKTKMLGYYKEKFVHYKHFTDLLHPDDYDKAMKAMQDHLTGAKDVYETVYRIKAKDGTYKVFYDKGKIVSKHDGVTKIAGMVMEVTKLQQAMADQMVDLDEES